MTVDEIVEMHDVSKRLLRDRCRLLEIHGRGRPRQYNPAEVFELINSEVFDADRKNDRIKIAIAEKYLVVGNRRIVGNYFKVHALYVRDVMQEVESTGFLTVGSAMNFPFTLSFSGGDWYLHEMDEPLASTSGGFPYLLSAKNLNHLLQHRSEIKTRYRCEISVNAAGQPSVRKRTIYLKNIE